MTIIQNINKYLKLRAGELTTKNSHLMCMLIFHSHQKIKLNSIACTHFTHLQVPQISSIGQNPQKGIILLTLI